MNWTPAEGTDHLVLYPGRGHACVCGEVASRFARCTTCRQVFASCGCRDAVELARVCCVPPWYR